MTKFNWQSNIKTNILTLRILGLWPRDESYKSGLYKIYATVVLTSFLLGHLFFQSVNIYFVSDDLEAVTGTIYVLLVEMVAAFKAYHVITHMAVLKRLLAILESDNFQPRSVNQTKRVQQNISAWRVIYQGFLINCLGTNIFWGLYPLLDKTVEERRLPFLAWYPYDTKKSPLYEITYVYQVISVGFITTVHVNIDTLMAALNVFNSSQFDILCDNLRHLHNLYGDLDVNVNLLHCVQHHKEILNFAKKCNNFLHWILLVQFLIFGFCIGLTMFQLSLMIPFTNEFFSLLAYGFAITLQLFMYCWFGNEVQVKSNQISYAAFEANWVEFSEDVKKKLLFFTIGAQKPIKLSALSFLDLSLNVFMRVLKTSYSCFALLHQVNSQNN